MMINAEQLSRDLDKQTLELTGNVKVFYDEQSLSCDRAIVHLQSETVEAYGNLKIVSPNVYVEGESALLNYRENTGSIYNGYIQSGQLLFEGQTLRKLGPDEYESERAYYTACATCPPAWSFTGTKIRAHIGGYAYIKNPWLQIAHVPVFWLPYLVVPLKSERQTGLLIPVFQFSSSGNTIGGSFFWAISDSQDATFTLKNYEKRGPKFNVEHRYVLSENSLGFLQAGVIRDKMFPIDGNLLATNPNFKQNKLFRYFFNYRHFYELPDNFTQYSNISTISDLFYPKDFQEDIGGYGEPSLESRNWLTYNTPNKHASVDVSYYLNLLKQNPLDRNEDSVHRFPEIRFSSMNQKIGRSGFIYHYNVNYINFAREDFSYDDVIDCSDSTSSWANPDDGFCVRDRAGSIPLRQIYHRRGFGDLDSARQLMARQAGIGRFDPGLDVIRTGQRLDIRPELSFPFGLGEYLDVLPSIALRHTQYSFDISPAEGKSFDTSPVRDYLQARVSLRTHAGHVFRTENPNDVRYKHEISPELILSTIPILRQTDHSFFGKRSKTPPFLQSQPISDSDFIGTKDGGAQGVQFDYNDRIINRNLLTAVLENKLIRRDPLDTSNSYVQAIRFKLSGTYDIDEATKSTSDRYPFSDIVALIDARFKHFDTTTQFNYYPYHNKTNTAARLRFLDSRGDYFQIYFTQTFAISENFQEAYSQRQEGLSFSANVLTPYVDTLAGIDFYPESFFPLSLRTKSWSSFISFKPPGNCWGIRLAVRQTIELEPDYTVNFDFKFGGDSPPPQTPDPSQPPAPQS